MNTTISPLEIHFSEVQDRTGRWTHIWATYFDNRVIAVEFTNGFSFSRTTRVEFGVTYRAQYEVA